MYKKEGGCECRKERDSFTICLASEVKREIVGMRETIKKMKENGSQHSALI